jgi:predicted Zn-dependent peptidase
MKISGLFQKCLLSAVCLTMLAGAVTGQRPGSTVPRQEKLLNGLKLLMWSNPAASEVKISVRIHSGSAFDPQGKEGVMKLLSENIFPTADSRSFFSEELGGGLEIVTNYDYIQINATARASEFVTALETIAGAVSNPTIDKETTAALKRSLAEKLDVLESDPAYIAQQLAAKRLFGTFPYGRPQMGSSDSVRHIDFADIRFAQERFLSADNATVAISGNFNGDLGYRAARRYLGAWLKSDKRVPATFRQPDSPDTKPLEIAVEGVSTTDSFASFAVRGIARNDPDYFASVVLANVLKTRSAQNPADPIVSFDSRVLPGVVNVRISGSESFPFALFSERITASEFAKAREAAIAELGAHSLADQWLDADTYQVAVGGHVSAFQKMNVADVQRVADRLAKNPIVSVLVRPAPAR